MQGWPVLRPPQTAVTAVCVGTFSLVLLPPRVAYSPHAHSNADQPLHTPPFSCGGLQPLCVAVRPLLPQLSGCRRIDEGTRRPADIRSRALLVPEVRPSL